MYREFGLDMSFIDRPLPAIRPLMLAAIRDAVDKFEPRANILNVEVEYYPRHSNWSIVGEYEFPWWVNDEGMLPTSKHHYFQLLNGQLEVRRYLNRRYDHTGHYLSAYGHAFLYDFCFDSQAGYGYQGEGWGAGLGYGFVKRLGGERSRWKLELFLKWGFLESRKLSLLLFADTTVYFAAMAAGVLLWAEFTVAYLEEESEFGRFLISAGRVLAGLITLLAVVNIFAPLVFTVDLDGKDSALFSPKDLRDNISCSLQKSMLYAGTVAENLRMGRPDATDDELWEALELARIADFIREKPEGLNFKLEQAGANVSGGQKQRLAIARAVLKNAPIYVFDDSFSALDFITEAEVRKALNERLSGRTRIVITQRVVSAMHSQKIFVLSNGSLVGCGTHAELLENCPIYREIYLSQTGGDIG